MTISRISGFIAVLAGLAIIQSAHLNMFFNLLSHPYVLAIKLNQLEAQLTRDYLVGLFIWAILWATFLGSLTLVVVPHRETLRVWLRRLDARGRAIGILLVLLLAVGIPKFAEFTNQEWVRGTPVHVEDPRGGSSDGPVFLHAGDSAVISVATIVPGAIPGDEIQCNLWAPEFALPALITPYALPHASISEGKPETDVYCAWEFGTQSQNVGSEIVAYRISACRETLAKPAPRRGSDGVAPSVSSEPSERVTCPSGMSLQTIYDGARAIEVSGVPFSLTNISVAVGIFSVLIGLILQLWSGGTVAAEPSQSSVTKLGKDRDA